MIPEITPFQTRFIERRDVDAFRALRIEALRLYPLAFTADLAEAEARSHDAWRAQVEAADGSGSQIIVLAETADGNLAGMAGVFTPPQPKLAHSGTVWGVYVRASHRQLGLGRALVQACADWARAKGLLMLKLSAVNAGPARHCYERCGFTAYGVEPIAVQWEGKLYDETLTALQL